MLDGWIVASIKQSRHYRLKAQENVMRITFEQGNLLFFAKWQIKRAMLFSMAPISISDAPIRVTFIHLAETQQSMLRIRRRYRKSN
jgi:outer membrane biogenesis lipoprotein LolB